MHELHVSITSVQVGHVIGKGGSTIKAIGQKTGTTLEIVEGPQVRITADDEAKLEAAKVEIARVVAAQEHPDYEGPVGRKLRHEADALGAQRAHCFDEATKRRSAGDHAGANALVAEAKQVGDAMEAKHREAAAAIARYNNEDQGKGENYLDMHGLREAEAMGLLQQRLAVLEAKPIGTTTEFQVIPGAGHHSAPGTHTLKESTEAYLREHAYAYKTLSAGSYEVIVHGRGGAALEGAAATTSETAAAVEPPAAKSRAACCVCM